MPRKQSTATRRARALTRAGTHRYTDALRRSGAPPVAARKSVWDQGAADAALARALRRAGLVEDAEHLQSVVDYEAPDDLSATGWASSTRGMCCPRWRTRWPPSPPGPACGSWPRPWPT
ncbi:hypothetical protein GCM10010428_45690 [Actinosynnema pretiosum subsp. pretiosum]